MIRLAVPLLAAVTAWGQFSDLASTDDGSQVYFSSALRLKGTNQFLHSKIFRVGPGPVELVEQRERVGVLLPTNAYWLHSPQVSGDGLLIAYTATLFCGSGSSCLLREVNYTSVRDLRTGRVREIAGTVRLSRNGRYALVGSRGFGNPPVSLLDLETGERTSMSGGFLIAGGGRRVVSTD